MIAYLKISSYIGMSLGATHFYGQLYCNGKTVDLERVLSERDAAKLNKSHSWKFYKAGSRHAGFESKGDVIDSAILCYKTLFPEASLLVLGSNTYSEPMPILNGPPEAIQDALDLMSNAIDINWWEGGKDKEMLAICKKWDKLLERYE